MTIWTSKTFQSVIAKSIIVLFIASLATPAPARERTLFGGLFRLGQPAYSNRRPPKKIRVRRKRKKKRVARRNRTTPSKEEKAAAQTTFQTAPKGPLQVLVSLPAQTVRIYQNGQEIGSSNISTGKPGNETPAGVFTILQKKRWHNSNIYSNAPMPFMQRITWSGIALHQGVVPDYPASHGCIRLPKSFAQALFGLTNRGAQVVVAVRDVAPKPIDHEFLIQPTPLSAIFGLNDGDDNMAELEGVTDQVRRYMARSQKPVRVLITRRTGRERLQDVQKALIGLGYELGDADGYMGPKTYKAVRGFQEDWGLPNSGLVSAELVTTLFSAAGLGEPKTGHIYVRQGFREVFSAPVILRDAEQPLGTHVFTAMQFTDSASKAPWTEMTLKSTDWVQPIYGGDGLAEETSDPLVGLSAAQALNRVDIPEDIRRRLSRLLTPGSSLVITDNGLGRENNKGTDFVVVTHNGL